MSLPIEWAHEPEGTIDANGMTHFHMDVWAPDGFWFRIKLVDYGEDGIYGFAPDGERELTFLDTTTPPFEPGKWLCMDLPLEDFMNGPLGLFDRGHMSQLIISGAPNVVFVDNIYFHK